jgi:hypothetical protein
MSAGFSPYSARQSAKTIRNTDIQIISCAGSGKTEPLSRHVVTLIYEGIVPVFIIAYNFIGKADAELKELIYPASDQSRYSRDPTSAPLRIGSGNRCGMGQNLEMPRSIGCPVNILCARFQDIHHNVIINT